MPRLAGNDDASELARILTLAFDNDPVMNWAFGSPQPIATVFRELIDGCYLKKGFAHIIDGAAAALWLPCGQTPKIQFHREGRIAISVFRAGGVPAVQRALIFSRNVAQCHPKAPHFYLFAVGVLPNKQGRGLGRAILKEGLAMADREGANAYLENSRAENTPLYRSLGFEKSGEIPLPEGAPELVPMWRPAAESK